MLTVLASRDWLTVTTSCVGGTAFWSDMAKVTKRYGRNISFRRYLFMYSIICPSLDIDLLSINFHRSSYYALNAPTNIKTNCNEMSILKYNCDVSKVLSVATFSRHAPRCALRCLPPSTKQSLHWRRAWFRTMVRYVLLAWRGCRECYSHDFTITEIPVCRRNYFEAMHIDDMQVMSLDSKLETARVREQIHTNYIFDMRVTSPVRHFTKF